MPIQNPGSRYIDRRRRLAESLMAQGSDVSPVQHWTQGMGRLASGLMGGWLESGANKADEQRRTKLAADLQGILKSDNPLAAIGQNPDLAEAYGPAMVGAKIRQASVKPPASVQEYEYAKANGYTGSFADFKNSGQDAQEKFGMAPIWGTDEQGNPVLLQASNRGGVRAAQIPEGVTPQRGQTSRVDLGDKFGVLDANGALIGYMPKGIGPERTVQDDRILTLPGVPGGQPSMTDGTAQQPAPMAPGQSTSKPGSGVVVQELPQTPTETRKEEARKTQQAKYANVVSEDIDRAIEMIKGSETVTGLFGAATQNIPGTPGFQVAKLIETIKANAGFDRLQEMRAASPTGGALGQVSNFENKLLQATIGNLEQSQDKEQLLYNLKRVKDIYLDIIHGPGNRPGNGPAPTEDDPLGLLVRGGA